MNRDLDELTSTFQEIWRFVSKNHGQTWFLREGTPLQFFAVRFLMHNPNSSLADLTKRFHITKSSATQLVERLEKQNLVIKRTDKKDRRVVHLNPTRKAKEIIDKMKRERDEQMRKIFSKVSSNDMRELIRIHLSLLKSLREEYEKH